MGGDEFTNTGTSFKEEDVPCMVLADGVIRDTVGARCERVFDPRL